MIVIVALLALPLGYAVKNRMAAYVAFGLAFAHVYTFQTANLVMEWVNGADVAFEQSSSTSLLGPMMGYFTFTTLVLLVGYGLVTLGHFLRTRRASKTAGAGVADLEAGVR